VIAREGRQDIRCVDNLWNARSRPSYASCPKCDQAGQSAESDSAITVRNLLLGTPSEVDALGLSARAGLLVLIAWWGIGLISLSIDDAEINSSFLHGPLLVFHEAGHRDLSAIR
jgi:hypothetical protein